MACTRQERGAGCHAGCPPTLTHDAQALAVPLTLRVLRHLTEVTLRHRERDVIDKDGAHALGRRGRINLEQRGAWREGRNVEVVVTEPTRVLNVLLVGACDAAKLDGDSRVGSGAIATASGDAVVGDVRASGVVALASDIWAVGQSHAQVDALCADRGRQSDVLFNLSKRKGGVEGGKVTGRQNVALRAQGQDKSHQTF